jgi:diguanylate cyclase (GGDEF)-like protein
VARRNYRPPFSSTGIPATRLSEPATNLPDSQQELSTLIETLITTGQRLEEVTAGQIDTVVGPDGRTFLLPHAQEQLRDGEAAKQAAILDALPAHIALLNTQGIIISVNDAWRQFATANTMQGPQYCVGSDYLDICDRSQGDGSSEARHAGAGIRAVLSGEQKSFSMEYPCHSPAEHCWFLLTVTPVGADRPRGAVVMHLNITPQRSAADQLAHLAQHDCLTDLPNRVLLNDRIGQAIALAPRHNQQVAVLFLDLDGFKHINDSLGHPVGDILLQSIARRLEKCVRPGDTVSRQGGDEFVLLLSEADREEDSAVIAKRILQSLDEPYSIGHHELHVTASIGISVYPEDGMDAEALIKNADTAMYRAKDHGRNSYRFFKPEMNVRAVQRQTVEAGLRRALQRQEFTLHYQPKVSLNTGAITGAEALIRWIDPTRGQISPAQFIPIAEECGLIRPIGAWALREACKQAQAWRIAGLSLASMAVNVSATQLQDGNFLQGVFNILNDVGMDPNSLELELTEGVLMKYADSSTPVLQALRETGVQVSIDDFGTGYSSLSYLGMFPIDALKIDQSFVRQIGSGQYPAVVKAVISMARDLKLRVIAEGVETQDELEFLKAHLCHEAQGYYFSRPVPPDQFATLLRDGVSTF